MLFSLFLVMLLGQAPAAPVPTFAEAVQLADAGLDAEALSAFQARAAVNPEDHDARLWIARLHERMGHDDLAEAVYRSVLLENPASVPAMTGVGRTVLARHEIDEALDVLERAEQMEPRNDEVLAAIAAAHRQAHRDRDAIVYLERAYATSPTQQHLLRLEDAQRAFQHRVETRGFNEQFSGATPDANGGEVALNYRWRDSLRLTARAEVERKFRVRDERGGGGIEWAWRPDIVLHGQVLIGPDAAVIPEGDYLGALQHLTPTASWMLAVRYFDFNGAWVSMIAPSVEWAAAERLNLSFGYALTTTESNTFSGREHGNNVYARGAYRLYPRLWITAGATHGVEDFDHLSIDRIGNFDANTVSAGARFELRTLTSISGGYDRQWRPGGVTLGRVSLSLAQRF